MKKALSDEQVRELIEFREKAINDENQRLYNAKTLGEQRGIQIGYFEFRRLIANHLYKGQMSD